MTTGSFGSPAATSSRVAADRPTSSTRAPAFASARLVAAPIPRLAPVTTAFRPASSGVLDVEVADMGLPFGVR
jgi:hypothetical protein